MDSWRGCNDRRVAHIQQDWLRWTVERSAGPYCYVGYSDWFPVVDVSSQYLGGKVYKLTTVQLRLVQGLFGSPYYRWPLNHDDDTNSLLLLWC